MPRSRSSTSTPSALTGSPPILSSPASPPVDVDATGTVTSTGAATFSDSGDVRTRLVALRDAEALRAIYNAEVLDSTVTMDLVPRSVVEQQEWIVAHQGVHAALVAVDGTDDGERILGFASLSPWRDRPAYRGTVENSVYVSRAHHRRRIGSHLLDGVLSIARNTGFHACMARIADGNEASIRLHASHGFEIVGVEREVARKFNRWIDVTVMQLLL